MFEKRVNKSLGFSILLHILLLVVTLYAPVVHNPQKINTVEVEFKDATPAPLPKVAKEDLKQVVDQDDTAVNDEIDTKAKYLSKHNQAVKKQTISKNHGEFVNASGDNPQQGSSVKQKLTLNRMLPKMDFAKAVQDKANQEQEFDKLALQKAINTEPRQAIDRPSPTKPGGNQASQSLDYIKDLDPGMETLLSTREFVYYTFYSRIRTQLNQYWGPKVREKLTEMFKQGRNIASSDDKISKLLITLNPKGLILRIQIIGNSGYRELDEAAVEAFKAAAPFPNPPSGIVDQDGTIKIRWDFILEA